MGGLVIKKAYVLAKQIIAFEAIASRILAMFFLATPHRGSDMAELLTRILSLGGARPFVRELHRNSPTLQAINEEFPRFSENLQIFSFFETQPMNYGIGKGLIVDKDSAVLNYRNERTAYLNANHRDVARYPSRTETSYITVRNALATTIDTLRSERKTTTRVLIEDQRLMLESFLGITDTPEDMLCTVANSHLDGSCGWFIQKDSFRRWRDNSYSELLWLQGKPGVGKSVLSGHVITHLRRRSPPKDCCFYFFARSEKAKCTISYFLRSLAYQMATLHPRVLDIILQLSQSWKDGKIGKTDHTPIWRRVFVNGILKAKLDSTQYWVIDGLDECRHASELLSLLTKAQEMWPLCILITSRDSFDTTALFQPKGDVCTEQIHENDTKCDISMLIDSRIASIPAKNEAMRDEMRQRIIDKSTGCFLWVDLVLRRLQKAQLSTDVQRVLNTVPSDMNELYCDILNTMSEEQGSRNLAKAILRWAACAARPMSTEEFRTALELDLDDSVNDVRMSIAASCGHLVYVDAQSRVRLVHQTAREFLTDVSVQSEFVIKKSTGHFILALTCLKYLSGNQLRPEKSRKLSIGYPQQTRSPFVDYAAVYLFDHVSNAGVESQNLVPELAKFLESPNVLSWIEYLAVHAGLSRLLQAGKVLGNLLKHGAYSGITGISRDMILIEQWGVDITRLVSKFGRELQSHPKSIHDLIPPLCPTSSAIYRRFASHRGLHLVGSLEATWNDCSSMITYGIGETITTVICSDRLIALGTMQKQISIYDQFTYQLKRRIDHQEPVMLMSFGATEKYLAAAGTKFIRVWALDTGNLVNKIPIRFRCMALAFVNDDQMLLAALRNNEFIYWDIPNDTQDNARWTIDPDVRDPLDFLTPTTAVMNVSQGLLAVVYRAYDVLVWNFAEEVLHDHYCRETGSRINADQSKLRKSSVLALTFSNSPDSTALIAAYGDGELVLYDTELGQVRLSAVGVNAQTMCSSPDGRTLATGDAAGTIQIFDLESLKFLYRISFDAQFISARCLTITSDSHRLLDIRGRQCRIWEPLALLRQEADDANSDALSVSTIPQEIEFEGPMLFVYITAITCSQNGEYIICGKDDGGIHLYRTATGQHLQELAHHATAIRHVHLNETTGILICVDQSSRVTCWQCISHPRSPWQVEQRLDKQFQEAMLQIVANHDSSRLLISTMRKDILVHPWDPDQSHSYDWGRLRKPFAWTGHATSAEHLIYLEDGNAYLYTWENLKRVSEYPIPFDSIMASPTTVQFKQLPGSPYLVTISEDSTRCRTETQFWTNASLHVDSQCSTPVPAFSKVTEEMEQIIGVYKHRLVFFHTDGWIRSVPLDGPDPGNVQEHFFIPADWHSLTSKAMIEITPQGDVVFAKRSELVIIRRGIEFEEAPSNSRTSSMSGRISGIRNSPRSTLAQRPRLQHGPRSTP
jgi:WD40 repeat protein